MTELETKIWNAVHNWCDAQSSEIPDQNRRFLMDEIKALTIMENLKWIECGSVTKTFRLQDEPELIHIIKTGFKDKYMVVYENVYELNLGKVTYGTKTEIESRFGITL